MKLRRVLSLLVALVMTVEVLPLSSLATEIEDATESVEVSAEVVEEAEEAEEAVEEESAVLLGASDDEADEDSSDESGTATDSEADEVTVIASGECGADGANVVWTVTSDGVLTISGIGIMSDYRYYAYTQYGKGDRPWSLYSDSITSAVVEEGVTTIGCACFFSCNQLVSVSIPSTVCAIGPYAFAYCSNLTSVVIPENVTVIDDHAFHYCTSLRKVTIPYGVTTIEQNAFSGCSSLLEIVIPDSVTSIGYSAFGLCALESVQLSSNLEELGDDAFVECTSLESITLPDSLTSIGSRAFYKCYALTSVSVPSSVVEIGEAAFRKCTSLAEVTLHNGLISIGDSAFQECSSLTSIVIPNSVETVGQMAFYKCTGLEKVTLSNSMCEIKRHTFGYCSNLVSIELPDKIDDIGTYAFYECRNLESINLENVSSIGQEAFNGCYKLNDVTLSDQMTSIERYTFCNCYSFTSIVIPDGVVSIDYCAFYNSGISSVYIPDGVTAIDTAAFYGCNLISVTIPESVETIGNTAFNSNSSLKSVYILNPSVELGEKVFSSAAEGFTIYGYADSTAQAYAEEYGYNFVDIEDMFRLLSISVCDSDGTEITDGFSVAWYDENGNLLVQDSLVLDGADKANTYTVVVTLDNSLLAKYVQPEPAVFAPEDAASKEIVLSDVSRIELNGSVYDYKGIPLEGVTVTVTNNTYGDQYIAQTDSSGAYSIEIPCADISVRLQMNGYYSHSEYIDLSQETASVYDLGCYNMISTVSDSIVLTVTQYDAVTDSSTSVGKPVSSLEALNITLIDDSGSVVVGYEVQGTAIIFEPNVVSAGDVFSLTVSDPSGKYADSETVTVKLDTNKNGTADVTMIQKGGFIISDLSGPEATIIVFKDGKSVLSETLSLGKQYSGYDEGTYTIVLIQNNSLLLSVPTMDYLSTLGLAEGTDYLKITVDITNGMLVSLDGYALPELDETKISYVVEESSYVKTNRPGGMTVGDTFTLHVAYELDQSKGKSASSVKIVFPEGVSPYAGSNLATFNGKLVVYTFDEETNTATIITTESSGVLYLYCETSSASGNFDISAYLQLTDGIMQPLGTAKASVQVTSISITSRTSESTIPVSGFTAPNSEVTIYDNGIEVAKTMSNAIGAWSTEITLVGELFSYSYHYIHITVDSDLFDGTAISEKNLVVYDVRANCVKTITMYNYGHSPQKTVINLSEASTVTLHYNYNPSFPTLTFTVELSDGDNWIEDLYIYTIDQYGDVTYVKLTYDDTVGLWTGKHDYSSKKIPAQIGVAYSVASGYYLLPEDDEYDEYLSSVYEYIDSLFSDSMGDSFENCEVVYDNENDIYYLVYVDPDTGEQIQYLAAKLSFEEIDDSVAESTLAGLGYDANVNYDSWVRVGSVSSSDGQSHAVVINSASVTTQTATSIVIASSDSPILSAGFSDFASDSGSSTGKTLSDKTSYASSLDTTEDNLKSALEYLGLCWKPASIMLLGWETAEDLSDWNIVRMKASGNADALNSYLDTLRNLVEAKCSDGSYKLSAGMRDTYNVAINTLQDKINAYSSECESKRNAALAAIAGTKAVGEAVGKLTDKLKGGSLALDVLDINGGYTSKLSDTINDQLGLSDILNDYNDYSSNRYNSLLNEIERWRNDINNALSEADCGGSDPAPTETTKQNPVEGVLDPSGYVYEAVPSNTLEGVTAVISYNNNGTAIEWDAEAYSQANPQVTDESGTFQWDVPTGEWIVSFTKDGYYSSDTSDSANANDDGWLPVPPPQVNIAVAMVSTASPTVESVIAYTDRIEIVFSQYMDMSDSDAASALNSISVTRDGTVVDVIVTALDAEYDLEGTTQYATRFAVVPSDGNISDGMVVTVNGSAENYAGAPIGTDYVSDALTVQVRPTEISSDDSVEAVMHETTSIEVALMPAISGTTLTVESSSEDIVSVTTASVTTDANGIATLQIEGQLPGAGVITVTEPISGVSTTIDISVVWVASNVAVEPVVATLDDGTVLTSGMTIPAGSVVTLSTTTSDATIRYTVNDTCPKKDAALYYSDPIVIDEDTVLRAAAYLDGTYSSTIRLELTVDDGLCSHVSGEAVQENIVNATCTTDGSYDSVVYCSICHEELSRETIVVPAAHTAGTAVRENVVEATRTTEGSYDLVTYCTVCGEEISRETVTVPATGVDMVTVWLRTPADYSAVNNAIAKANALDSGDYTNFSDVTDAINAVNWTYNALMQSYVNEMAEKIETAIANLIPVGTTTEVVEIQEPIEDTNTDTEDDDEEKPFETSEPESNPTTGIVFSILPMMIAALAAVSAKRR